MTQVRLQHTYTGKDVNVLDLQKDDIHIEDIAHSLAMQCRFAGHVRFHYSVAQHCVYVADRLEKVYGDVELALLGLLHDAAECYLTDLPRPMKELSVCEFYRNAEVQVQRRILCALNLPMITDESRIKQADNDMLAIECRTLFTPAFIYGVAPKWHVAIEKWAPEKAEAKFLSEYHRLMEWR